MFFVVGAVPTLDGGINTTSSFGEVPWLLSRLHMVCLQLFFPLRLLEAFAPSSFSLQLKSYLIAVHI